MARFDETDFRIMRELTVDGPYVRHDRVSIDALARALGLHRSTVAERMAKWQKAGVFQGASAEIEPASVGLCAAHVQFRSRAPDREKALRTAGLVDGVMAIVVFDHDWLGVMLYADSRAARERTVRLLREILHADEEAYFADSLADFPDVEEVELSPLDARILATLLDDARRAPADIARELGVAKRTVERRIARLQEEGVYFMTPRFDAGKLKGMVVGLLSCRLAEATRAKALREILERAPNHMFRQLDTPGRASLGLFGASVAELDRMSAAVAAVPGVSDVRLRIMIESHSAPHFNEWMAERIRRHAAQG